MARKRRYDSYESYYFPPARPLEAKGGIKAKSQRGAFGESWWAKRWIAVLESFNMGARLGRGKSYARRGQVTDVAIAPGLVKAKVQGTRATPYSVKITVQALSDMEWRKVADRLGEEALFVAKLLAGEMPPDIEQIFDRVGLSLFPSRSKDLTTDCSCPDWSNPCKHIAAVYYLLGEEFDRDPFLIFVLRGMSREGLVNLLGPLDQGEAEIPPAALEEEPPQSLPDDPSVFWGGAEVKEAVGEVPMGGPVAALPRRLGSFPFWRGQESFLDSMERIYREAAQAGLEAVAGREAGEDE